MHARELIELAALVSVHGPVLVVGEGRVSTSALEQYWTASKSRLDRWGRALKQVSQRAARGELRLGAPRLANLRAVLEEIVTGEVLTRVWTAVLCAYDWRRGTDRTEPVARSVMTGHLEARHRVLTLLLNGPSIGAEEAVKLNRLRRRTERWTDLLIGYLTGLDDVSRFAVNPIRAREFAEDLRYRSHLKGGRFAWPLLVGSLRAAFARGLGPTSPNEELNARIAASILASFPPELFDSTGLFRSLWLLRLTNVTSDTQGMVDELLGLEHAPISGEGRISHRLSDRVRRYKK
ncbi:MAG: hypothetical protein ACYTG0_10865 [Planctomycetota bacterium]|jgi:hypothetical protein